MKKSERYQVAMRCVVACDLSADSKIEIIDTLLEDKRIAKYSEEQEAAKALKNKAVVATAEDVGA